MLPTVPLDARLVVYVRGLAIARGHASAVQISLGRRRMIVVRFPRMTISDKAFTIPPFETSDDGQQRMLRGNAHQESSNASRKKKESIRK